MSEIREKAVQMLNEIPEEKIIYVIDILKSVKKLYSEKEVKKVSSNKAAARASIMKYQGRLPEDFNSKNERLEALDEKYSNLN